MELKRKLERIFEDKETIKVVEKAILSCNLDINEKNILKRLELENRERENKKLDDIKENIEIYISFYSFAKPESWEYTPIYKSLKVLNNLKKCILLATVDSYEQAEEEKKRLLKEFRTLDIEICKISIGDDSYEEIYSKLEYIVNSNGILLENYIIDYTLGFRFVTGVFYKFAVEQGIKLISWQSEHCSVESRIKRIPATDRLNLIEFPQMKNCKNIRNINILIRKFKYREASYLCEAINNIDRAYLLELLGKVFTVENMLNRGKFLEELEEFNKNSNNKIKNKNIIKLYKNYNKVFDMILKYEDSEAVINSVYFYIGYLVIKMSIEDESVKKQIERVYYDMLKDEEFIKEEFEESWIIDKIEDSYDKDKGDDDLFCIVTGDYNIENKNREVASQIIGHLKKAWRELELKLPKQIYLEGNRLNIHKYNLEIELTGKFDRKSSNMSILRELLNSDVYEIKRDDLDNIFEDKKLDSKKYVDLKLFLKEFNNFILQQLRNEGIESREEFIVIPTERLTKLKSLKVSEKFYNR